MSWGEMLSGLREKAFLWRVRVQALDSHLTTAALENKNRTVGNVDSNPPAFLPLSLSLTFLRKKREGR